MTWQDERVFAIFDPILTSTHKKDGMSNTSIVSLVLEAFLFYQITT
jgi:hypothetical protein